MNSYKSPRVAMSGAAAVVAAAVVILGTITPVHAAELSIGDPVLNLKFEENTVDNSPLKHPSKLVAVGSGDPAVEYVDGVTEDSSAIKLNGNTYIDLGNSTRLQPANLTLSFWIRPTSAMSGEEVITWSKDAYNSDGWYLSSEGDSTPLALSIGPATGQPYKVRVAAADRNAFFPVNEWTHIAVTYNQADKSVHFYRNGHGIQAIVANPIAGTATGILGSDEALPKTIGFNGPRYNGAYLRANLDEYQLYEGVGTLQDIADLYERGGRTLDKAALATEDRDGIVLPTTATVALILPDTGSNGSAITWRSSNPAVIDETGQVTRPGSDENDAEVTLTATVRYLDSDPLTRTSKYWSRLSPTHSPTPGWRYSLLTTTSTTLRQKNMPTCSVSAQRNSSTGSTEPQDSPPQPTPDTKAAGKTAANRPTFAGTPSGTICRR